MARQRVSVLAGVVGLLAVACGREFVMDAPDDGRPVGIFAADSGACDFTSCGDEGANGALMPSPGTGRAGDLAGAGEGPGIPGRDSGSGSDEEPRRDAGVAPPPRTTADAAAPAPPGPSPDAAAPPPRGPSADAGTSPPPPRTVDAGTSGGPVRNGDVVLVEQGAQLRGSATAPLTITGSVVVRSNQAVVEHVIINEGVTLHGNGAVLRNCVVRGNVEIRGNGASVSNCDIFGALRITGNGADVIGCRVQGGIVVSGNNASCSQCAAFADENGDFVVGTNEVGAPLTCGGR